MTQFLPASSVAEFPGVVIDCRFSLADAQAGRQAYGEGHIPGAVFLDTGRDLSGPKGRHGGRHPLPTPGEFATTLADLGIDVDTPVLIYDDSDGLFAARCWWMLRALGFPSLAILAGGYAAWLAGGGVATRQVATRAPVAPLRAPAQWPLCCDREALAQLQARGATLVDAREAGRYRGDFEPIDPVAGHIPGAVNLPWQSLVDSRGGLVARPELEALWGSHAQADPLVVYCGSGVSACVNILSLALLGRQDVWLYGGSWSDWCSYLDATEGQPDAP